MTKLRKLTSAVKEFNRATWAGHQARDPVPSEFKNQPHLWHKLQLFDPANPRSPLPPLALRPELVSMVAHRGVYGAELPLYTTRAQMYRAFMRHLRLLPDPHLWMMVVPKMRKLCEAPVVSRSSLDETWVDPKEDKRRKMTLKAAKSRLNDIRAAVACHHHALERVLEEVYAQRGEARFAHLDAIARSCPPVAGNRPNEHLLGPTRPPLPAPLQCLLPQRKSNPEPDKTVRVRASPPIPNAGATKAREQWMKERDIVEMPLTLPGGSGAETGWEKSGIVESLRALSGAGDPVMYAPGSASVWPTYASEDDMPLGDEPEVLSDPSKLPTYAKLPRVLRRIFPIKLKPTMREPPYPKPPPHETRSNPRTWNHPVPLTRRILARVYARLWNDLPWVRPTASGGWVRCTYDDMLRWEAGVPEERLTQRISDKRKVDPYSNMSSIELQRWSWAARKQIMKLKKQRIDVLTKEGIEASKTNKIGERKGFQPKYPSLKELDRDFERKALPLVEVEEPWQARRREPAKWNEPKW